MTISLEAKNKFDKIHCLFMIKIRSKLEIQENFLNMMKTIYKKNPHKNTK